MASLGLTVARIEKQVIVTAPGIQGPPGIQGEVGDTGGTGPIGPQGNSISIKGTLAAGVWSAPASPTIGDIWIAGGVITGDVTAILGDGIQWTGTLWVNVGQVRGPIGLTGNSCIIRGTMSAGAWSAPGSPVAGDAWIAGGVITGAVTAVLGDGIVFNGTTWNNVGQLRGPVGPSGSVNGTVGKGAVFNGTTSVANSAFMAEDANGINVTGGNLNSTQGSAVSMARSGAGHIGAICLSNVSGSRAETVLTGQALGTGDWSAYTKVLMPSVSPTGTAYLWSIYDPGSSDCVFFNFAAGGALQGQAKKTGETTLAINLALSAVLTPLLGQVVGLGVKRAGNVVTFYINGISVGTLTGNACTVSYSASAKSQAGNIISGPTPFLGNIYCNRIYNRALSDAEFAAIGSGGVDASDEYGSQTPIYTSDFSAGVDGWTTQRTTNSGNVDAISGVNDVLQITVDGTASNTHYSAKAVTAKTCGKRYRITGSYYIPAANALVTAAKIISLSTAVGSLTVTGAWTTFSFEFIAGQNSSFTFQLYNGVNGTFSGNGTDSIYIKDFVLTPIGCISAPNFAQGNGATLYDRSPNGLHSVLSGTYTHTIPVKRIVVDDLQVMNDVTGNFGASQGSLPSTVRAAGGTRGGIVFGATSGSRAEVPALTGQALGTGDFTVLATVRIPTSLPAINNWYLWTIIESVAVNSIGVSLRTDGSIQVACTKASVTVFTPIMAGAQQAYSGQVVTIGISRSGTTITGWINGGIPVSATNASADVSYTAAAKYTIGGDGGANTYQGRVFWAPLYNRLLTTAEVLDAGLYGISAADEWGSCTPVYTSDFSAGVDGWSGTRAAVAGNVDAIGSPSLNDWLGVTVDATASATHSANKFNVLTIGKRYRLTATVFVPSGQSAVNGVRFQDTVPIGSDVSVTGANQSFTAEFVATGTALNIYALNGSSGTFTGNGTDVVYVKNVVITQIGAIVDIDLAAGQGSTLPGRSTNYLDATLYGSWTHVVPRWSGEWWSRLPWYLFNSISALGVNYERAFAKWTTNVFQFGVEKGGSGTLRDFGLMLGSTTVILMKSASLVPFSNSWRVNKSSATIAAGATYTPADTINDFHEVTINSGSGTTPIALTNLIAVSTDARTVRFLITNSTGSSVTVTTTGAVTNISQAVAASGKIMVSVSIIGTTAFATVVV